MSASYINSTLTLHFYNDIKERKKSPQHADRIETGLPVLPEHGHNSIRWYCISSMRWYQNLVSRLNYHTIIRYTMVTILEVGRTFLPFNSTKFLREVSDVHRVIGKKKKKKLAKLKYLIHVPITEIPHFNWDLYYLPRILKWQLPTSAFQSCSLKLFHLLTSWAVH